jgi:ATP/maltotriose-dependent transcriptional regulator MalT
LPAAEAVCAGDGIEPWEVLDLLGALVDKSLVVVDKQGEETRYRLLETVRQYGRDRLLEAGEAEAVRERHRDWFLALAEEVDAQFRRSVQETWLDRVEKEYENFRAALGWSLTEERGVETGLLLARTLTRFWEVRGYLSEGRAFLAQALGRLGADPPTRERAKALNAAAVLAWMQGDAAASRALFDESLVIERTLGDTAGVAWSLHHLGHVAALQGEYETAKALYQESLALFRELQNQTGIAFSLADQGNMALKEGDLGAAQSLYEESLRISRELGNKVSIAIALNNLGKIAREQGDTRAAWALHRESLTTRLELGDKGGYPWSLEAFARLAASGDPERAARWWGAAEALRESLGLPLPPNEREEYDRYRSAAREALGEEPFAIAWAEGRAMTPEQAVASALEEDEESQTGRVGDAATRRADGSSSVAQDHRLAAVPPRPPVAASPLPRPLTPFFGREAEIRQVKAMLEGSGARPVTLTGLGGTGKTRLALEVARLLQESGAGWAGVAFVSLADLTDPRLIGQTLQAALNLSAAGAADPLEPIAALAADRPFLLVLDNFEQLLPEGASTVRELLEHAPRLVCLVTSRRPLGLATEEEFPVAPLPTPAAPAAPERLLEYASVRLFASRAQAARPEFQVTPANATVVAHLCQALEGIPLALELAAARAAVLTPAQMLQHLPDRFGFLRRGDGEERHQTLRAALHWSYRSLPESQRRLLARLSVFRGGWTLEAAEAVCAPGTDVLDALTALRNASLISAEEAGEAMRFGMLETVREYGAERLAEWDEAEPVRERHRDFFLELAERAERELDGPASVPWLDRLEAERENLRAALAWCRTAGAAAADAAPAPGRALAGEGFRPSATGPASATEGGLRLAGALGRFWEIRGHTSEGRFSLAEVLGRGAGKSVRRDEGTGARAKALMWAGVLAHGQTEYRSAREQFEESLTLYRQLGDQASIACVLHRLGNLTEEQGDYAEARRFHEESLSIRRALGDRAGIALLLSRLGNIALDQGDHASARAQYEESLAISRELGDRRGVYLSRHLLGVVAEHEGDLALARSIYEECLPAWREMRFQVEEAWVLHGIGYVAYRQGDFPAARSRLAESLTLFREMEYTGGLIRTLERFCGLAVAQGELERAARLLAAVASQRAATGARTALAPPQEWERDVAAVRAGVGAEAFATAWAEGQAMTLQRAIEYALQHEGEPERRPAVTEPPLRHTVPLLSTKLGLPAVPASLLPRPRLMACLDSFAPSLTHLIAPSPMGGRPTRVALLVASAGSGKTSLVSQWCGQQPDSAVAWLSLDAEDNHPERFLLYLCAALERVAPETAAPVRARLQTAQGSSHETVLTLLLNGVATLGQRVIVVLDDYHAIEATAVHQLVTFLLEHMPPNLFPILAARSDPPLPLARLRLQGRLLEIHDDELRFTDEEAGQFLNERMGLTLPPAVVQRLAERTEGWIAGLQMAALSLQGEADAGRFLDAFTGTDRYLVDYFFEEVLRRLPPEVQTFLSQTAFLKRLCAPLCETVTGVPDGQAMLERLEAANLFLIPLDRARQWYRYHQLFADVLQARLLPQQEEPLAVLQERAAAWFEAEGMVGEAIEHALAGGQFERAARLIARQGAGEPTIARLEASLETAEKQGREASALGARVLLAKLHWHAGRREQAVTVLQPALALAEREEHTRCFVAAGPELIPALRQAAVQGIAPETVGRLLTKLEERGAPLAGALPGAASAGTSLPLAEPLSERELEVLRLIAAGLRNAEIAAQLFLSQGTVHRHLHNLYGKLGVSGRTNAVARARALGLL